MARVVTFAGGGTGGHIFPALALAEAIGKCEPDVTLRFIGTEKGLEGEHVPAAGYALDLVPSRPVLGRGPLAKLAALVALARGLLAARRLLRAQRPDLVIGVGGYASVPAVLGAVTLGIPTALLEPNALPGRANRLLGRFAGRVFVQFDEALSFFKPDRVALLGYPVRDIPRGNAAPDDGAGTRLLITGGSQGARTINRAIAAGLEGLSRGFEIAHQTGPHDIEEVRSAYSEAGLEAEVEPFFYDMPERLARADLVVARSGAATVAELCSAGVAAVLVPYPYAADGHQMANARALERAGGCVVVPNAEAGGRLVEEVRTLGGDPERLRRMGEAAARRAKPQAAEQIWGSCRALLEERGAA
jgi:UDP-N-acetylglucosamine--N-acetylmuramyl-(pentapeptide) pyrophosphoryl-undecaprenol N-acetylglucosamine transferase